MIISFNNELYNIKNEEDSISFFDLIRDYESFENTGFQSIIKEEIDKKYGKYCIKLNISTAYCSDIRKGRRVGNTTRQCDFAIAYLFDGFLVEIVDHAAIDNKNKKSRDICNQYLLKMICDTLSYRYRIDIKSIKIEKNEKGNFVIQL